MLVYIVSSPNATQITSPPRSCLLQDLVGYCFDFIWNISSHNKAFILKPDLCLMQTRRWACRKRDVMASKTAPSSAIGQAKKKGTQVWRKGEKERDRKTKNGEWLFFLAVSESNFIFFINQQKLSFDYLFWSNEHVTSDVLATWLLHSAYDWCKRFGLTARPLKFCRIQTL